MRNLKKKYTYERKRISQFNWMVYENYNHVLSYIILFSNSYAKRVRDFAII